jgi:TonB-linked SusC/RagA family outer membrane protein
MKKKILRLFMMVSRFTFYGTLLQLLFLSLVFASKIDAQEITSIKKAEINVAFNQSSLIEVFSTIEANTSYEFIYFSPDLRTAEEKFDLRKKKVTVADLLLKLSEQYQLAFKQVNNSIVVRRLGEERSGIDKSLEILIQGITITGRVISHEDNTGLPGVNVIVMGTSQGTVTDIDGNYTLEVPDAESVLVFSSVGFIQEEVAVGNKTVIDMVLTPDITALDEIVVIGYGEQKLSDISGSVSTVSAEKIAQSPVPNLSNSLVGQAAGIIATQPTGEPGNDNATILIRGAATTGGRNPLYVIDGIERSASDFFQLNPSEVESVSILKDAASAAVFGMRAGNGVILVTTKRGNAGRLQISFNGSYGVQERTREPEFLNSYEYALLRNEALANSGLPPDFTDGDIQKYLDGSSPDTHPDTDWFDLLRDSAPMQQYNLSANGGTENIQYATSLSFLNQDGITKSDNFKRYNFRSNIDANVTNTTRFSFDISYRKQKRLSLGKGDELFRWLNTQPNKYPLEFSNGGLASGPAYISATENGYRRNEVEALRTRIQLHQQLPFIDGLSFKIIGAYDNTQTDNKNWYYPVVPFYVADGSGNLIEQPLPANSLDVNRNDGQALTFQTHLNYDKTFGKLDLSALVLYSQTEEWWEYISGHREGYTIGIDELNFGGTVNRNNSGYSGSSGRQGVVGRLNLAYAGKYIFETSVRVDGSEQFAPDQRWGVFPSISGAYVISEESFMDNITFFDFLKLRASYGELGNDQIGGSRFLYLQSYNINAGSYPYAVFGDDNVYPIITEGSLANPNVTWETVKKLDIGFDAFFLDSRLTFTFDYFNEKRSDILGRRNLTVPDFFGISLPVENLNRVDNRGFEMSLGYSDQTAGGLYYSVNANLTHARNEVVYIDEPEDINPNLSQIGHPIGTGFGYEALGIFQTQSEVDNWATQLGDTAPGDIKMADINEDGEINELDRVAIGVSSGAANVPEYIMGLNGTLKYKNFEFSFLFQGATSVNQYTCCEGTWPFYGDAAVVKTNLDYWTPENTDAPNPRILVYPTGNLNYASSSFWMKDASYLRLKNIELAYNAPQGFLGQRFIRGLRIYVNANNVAIWTKIKNWDPEYADDRYWSYPQLRIWNGGIQLTF